MPTISVTVRPEITRRSLAPRAAYLRFPIGNPMGEANKPDQQRTILRALLHQLERQTEPGTIDLPFRWRRM